jgi:hypothetical protein
MKFLLVLLSSSDDGILRIVAGLILGGIGAIVMSVIGAIKKRSKIKFREYDKVEDETKTPCDEKEE